MESTAEAGQFTIGNRSKSQFLGNFDSYDRESFSIFSSICFL
jgi:hypothetical protein